VADDRIRILIADDHELFRRGLRMVLEDEDDIEVVAEAADGEEAVRKARHLTPDVVLMDLLLPGDLDGIAATARILQERPDARVLVLTSYADDDSVLPAVRAGAVGYLLKDVDPADLVPLTAMHRSRLCQIVIDVAHGASHTPAFAPTPWGACPGASSIARNGSCPRSEEVSCSRSPCSTTTPRIPPGSTNTTTGSTHRSPPRSPACSATR
jgi:CheY-like chemotaxis protein